MKSGRGEAAFCFKSDTPEFRESFGLKGQKSSDAIFLLERGGDRYVFFVELKGKDSRKAAAQLESTIRAVSGKLDGKCVQSTKFGALVLSGGGLPSSKSDKETKEFLNATGLRLKRVSGKRVAIDEHVKICGPLSSGLTSSRNTQR